MSYEHAERMHAELAEQGIYGGDCFATCLDSILRGIDLPDGFYYDLVAARQAQDEERFEQLLRQQVVANFRQDHFTSEMLSSLSVYTAPDGNPLEWGAPTDPYEVVPKELIPLLKELPTKEWERVYSIKFDDETEADRRARAESARADMDEKLGIFVVSRNMILDGVSPVPVSLQGMDGEPHVFAVTYDGLEDIHIVDTIIPPDEEEVGFRPLARSPRVSLAWLCDTEENPNDTLNILNVFGDSYPRITDSNVPVAGQDNWKYAIYPVPPQK